LGRIITQEEAVEVRRKARSEGGRIVFTNGCFDILHRGHVQYLQSAKKLGDLLIVGVNSDSSVKRLKGGKRPIVPLEDRMVVLASLACVDYVVSFDDDTPAGLIDAIIPDVLVKGGDWKVGDVVGRETVERDGGRVVIIDFLEGYSTRSIIQRIVSRCGPWAGQE
jgi:D-beta-D-heptose 7-phosphate kinase/D-beta-D-heptose 1-phosphate adenosyltransferase